MLVLANKQDLPYAASPAEITDALELSALSAPSNGGSVRPWSLQPISAWTGAGLSGAMDYVAAQCNAGLSPASSPRTPMKGSLVRDVNDIPRDVSAAGEASPLRAKHRRRRRQAHRRGSSQ